MTGLPAATPVTTPVPLTTVASAVLPLVQAPPPASLSVVAALTHKLVMPVIADGSGLTVTVVYAGQPFELSVKVSNEVPAEIPDTTPVPATTVATPVVPLAHVPAPETSLKA